ncbi:MAG: copper transport protein [Nocardioidaceae bacterium]|nr:copper transport protein [Nocardioidaceae bacterium]
MVASGPQLEEDLMRERRRLASKVPPAVVLALALGGFLGALLVAFAGPAAAAPVLLHAEIASTSPHDGQRLQRPPQTLTIRFSEPVSLVEDSLRVLRTDGGPSGRRVAVGAPRVTGAVVRWPVSLDLGKGSYLVSWRVVSDDGHPVAGAFSFGVAERVVPAASGASGAAWSWPVAVARWLGDVAFSVVAGLLAFVLLCWPEGREDPRVRRLLLSGLVSGIVSSVLELLLQGPYGRGVASYRLLDRSLMTEVAQTSFGAWMQLRVYLYVAMAAVLWLSGALGSVLNRWLAVLGTLALATTFSGTGHASSGALPDRVALSVHVLTAGVWVGGLVTVVVLASGRDRRPGLSAFVRFSRLALAAVGVLLLSGVVNALLRLDTVAQLGTTGYGHLLLAKAVLVVAALVPAAASRRLVRNGDLPLREVRVEAVATTVVLALSAVLALTSPHGP